MPVRPESESFVALRKKFLPNKVSVQTSAGHEQSFESRQHAQFERAAKREAPTAATADRRASLSEVGTIPPPTPPSPRSLDQQQVEQSPRRLAFLARRSPSRRRIARAPQVGLRGGAGRHRGRHRPRSRLARHRRLNEQEEAHAGRPRRLLCLHGRSRTSPRRATRRDRPPAANEGPTWSCCGCGRGLRPPGAAQARRRS